MGQYGCTGSWCGVTLLFPLRPLDVSLCCRSGQHGGEGAVVVLRGVYLLGLTIIIDHLLDLRVIVDHLRGLQVTNHCSLMATVVSSSHWETKSHSHPTRTAQHHQ